MAHTVQNRLSSGAIPLAVFARTGWRLLFLAAVLVVCQGGTCCEFGREWKPARAVEVYDPVTDEWSQYSTMPWALGRPACCSISGTIYVTGGWSGRPTGSVGLFRLDLGGATWERLQDMPGPRSDHQAVVLGTDLYVLGGMGPDPAGGKGPLDRVEVFDTVMESWSSGPSLATGRRNFGAVELGGIIYAIGGSPGFSQAPLDSVEAYDPAVGSWQPVAPIPDPPEHLVAETDGSVIYVITCKPDVTIYDPIGDTWSPGPVPPPIFRCASVSAVVGDEIFLVQGAQLISWEMVTGTWTERSPRDLKRVSISGAAAGGGLFYILGGVYSQRR